MSRRTAIVLCLVGVLGLVASCKGNDKGENGSGIPIEDFAAEYTKASCTYLVRCGFAPDQATCLEADDVVTGSPALATELADVEAKRIAYDPMVAAPCLDALANRECGSLSISPVDACVGLFEGTVALGGACFIDTECASGACEPTDPACTGQCCAGTCVAAPAIAALGGDCSAGQPCATNTYCGQAGVCSPLIDGPGTPCRSITDCAPSLVCEGSRGCLPQAPLGGVCDATRNYPCADSARTYCDPTSGRCTARGGVGDACVMVGPVPYIGSCLTYERCDSSTAKCVLAGGLGSACASDSLNCQGVLTCDATSDTCAKRPPAAACM